MLPTLNELLSSGVAVKVKASKNYKMHITEEVVNGYCDNLEAMKQVIYKILNTQRYENIIYTWNYGIEINDLFGKSISYVCAVIEKRIADALVVDDRIESVDNFEYEIINKRKVKVSFIVKTIYGEVNEVKEIEV